MDEQRSRHISWQSSQIEPMQRSALLGQQGVTVWLTGLSGAGKSTIAGLAERVLVERGHAAYSLDGDNLRHGLNSDLGFSPADRTENIRRVGEVARLMSDAGLIVLTAFISPYRRDREEARHRHAAGHFLEVFIAADLATCENRDAKGLYRRARAGEIPEFTGISAPYEAPERPDLVLDSATESAAVCVAQLVAHLDAAGYLKP